MPGMLVPRVGIEPTLLAEPDFESGASTNFTTEALTEVYQNSTPASRSQWFEPLTYTRIAPAYCMCWPPLIAI